MYDKNHEGYHDPTASQGLGAVVAEELKQDKKSQMLSSHIKSVCSLAGFEVVGKITFRCKDTGRIIK